MLGLFDDWKTYHTSSTSDPDLVRVLEHNMLKLGLYVPVEHNGCSASPVAAGDVSRLTDYFCLTWTQQGEA